MLEDCVRSVAGVNRPLFSFILFAHLCHDLWWAIGLRPVEKPRKKKKRRNGEERRLQSWRLVNWHGSIDALSCTRRRWRFMDTHIYSLIPQPPTHSQNWMRVNRNNDDTKTWVLDLRRHTRGNQSLFLSNIQILYYTAKNISEYPLRMLSPEPATCIILLHGVRSKTWLIIDSTIKLTVTGPLMRKANRCQKKVSSYQSICKRLLPPQAKYLTACLHGPSTFVTASCIITSTQQ